jgi:hypothetical protein
VTALIGNAQNRTFFGSPPEKILTDFLILAIRAKPGRAFNLFCKLRAALI